MLAASTVRRDSLTRLWGGRVTSSMALMQFPMDLLWIYAAHFLHMCTKLHDSQHSDLNE